MQCLQFLDRGFATRRAKKAHWAWLDVAFGRTTEQHTPKPYGTPATISVVQLATVLVDLERQRLIGPGSTTSFKHDSSI